jgi:apolipoprotein N-acyltransferase
MAGAAGWNRKVRLMFTHTTRSSAPTDSSPPTRDQLVTMGAGGLAFFASFLPWVSVSLGFVSGSGNAWQSGLLAWASVLVCMAVAAVVAADRFLGIKLRPPAPSPRRPC